jgi:hypothetical protein
MWLTSRRIAAGAVAAVLGMGLAACTDSSSDEDNSAPPPVVDTRLPPPADPLPLDQLELFSGVARITMGSNCTGTLIDTGVASAPAYILTNGHCTGDVGRARQQTTVGEQWFGPADFFRAQGNLQSTLSVDAVELEYSTMRGRDLAVVRLDATLGQLQRLGVAAVPIADQEPRSGQAVVNVGVPVQNIDEDDQVLRRGDCTLGEQHALLEFGWLWKGSWANDCPGIIQGSSGSPVFVLDDEGAPESIASMINTTSWGVTADDGGACFINRPCQVGPGGAVMVEETSYGVSVAGVGRCFGADGVFALGGQCPLEVSQVWANRGGGIFRGGASPDSAGALPEVSLVGATAGTVRTAVAPLGDGTACTTAATYGSAAPAALPAEVEPWEDGLVLPVALPEVEGQYVLCAVRESDYAAAASVVFEVDRTSPILEAGASVEDLGNGALVVRPYLSPPEITTVRFLWGPADDVDCDDTAAFQDFFIVPLTLEPADLPATYCIYGLDAAGNATSVTKLDLR